MKNIKILLALLAIVSLSIACTTDDNSGSGSGSSSKARVVSKIIFEEDDVVAEYALKYDSDGRITRVTYSADDYYVKRYYNYGSDNELEIVREYGGEAYGGDHSYTTYALLNNKGYMTLLDNLMTLSYDSKGYLVSASESEEDWLCEISYLWSGGNIVEMEYMSEEEGDSFSYTATFDYNNKPMSMVNLDLNLVLSCWIGPLYVPYSWGDGLTGRKSKNFMTGWTYESSDDYEEEATISWSYDEDGYPKEALVEYDDGYEFCMTIKYKN